VKLLLKESVVKETKLKRCLSLFEVVVYGVGLIVGAGIYVLIGSASGIAGNTVWLSFVLASIIAGFTALSYSELSALFPRAAAEFIYVKEAFNKNSLAWIMGFIAILTGIVSVGTVSIGFAKYFVFFFDLPFWLIGLSLLGFLTFLNFWGIKESAKFNVVSTFITLSGLLLIILAGIYFIFLGKINLVNLFDFPIKSNNLIEMISPITGAAALIFFAYLGFEDMANIAEETNNPTKTLPKAFFLTLIISTLFYVLISIIAVSVIPFNELALAEQPLSLVAETLLGEVSGALIALIALFATASTVLIMLIVGARMIYGMSEENSLPKIFSKVHSKRKTPWVAILVFSLISLIFLFIQNIEVTAALTDIGIFTLFFFVNASAIMLRFTQPNLKREWKIPFNIGKIPLLSVLGALSCLIMIFSLNHPVHLFGFELSSLMLSIIVFGSAIPLYFLIGKN
jgi:basic amino acid/polyamine antiporter, APA family